jgi:hypothetical protein
VAGHVVGTAANDPDRPFGALPQTAALGGQRHSAAVIQIKCLASPIPTLSSAAADPPLSKDRLSLYPLNC